MNMNDTKVIQYTEGNAAGHGQPYDDYLHTTQKNADKIKAKIIKILERAKIHQAEIHLGMDEITALGDEEPRFIPNGKFSLMVTGQKRGGTHGSD